MFPSISPKIIHEHGLSPDEYQLIVKKIGRHPNINELGLFSVMWSEHCSYKNSKHLLKKFSFTSSRIIVGAGEENAGILDIGDGLGIVFKVESHNHPSAIEPYQGAATGVGGIIRDIFTMGARPVASMNSLRFGHLTKDHNRYLFERVIEGIADYGNCVGVPTIGGEAIFDSSYENNPLVNVFCLGIVRHEDISRGSATGVGNSVIYIGSLTGRDGIHGATFASGDLTKASEQKKSAVQVGDPFMEKILLESCLEVIEKKLIVGIQDMGAGGLTCALSETAGRGKSGMKINLSLVPCREKEMSSYEILLSESQERMLLIVEPSRVKDVQKIFTRWNLKAPVIGEVTDSECLEIFHDEKIVVNIPVDALSSGAPVYRRQGKKPERMNNKSSQEFFSERTYADYQSSLLKLCSSANICKKSWIYEQFDHMVQTNTLVLPGSDSSTIRVKGSETLLSISMGGNGRYCYFDPYEGGKIAVSEVARNIICSGALPIGMSDCLNFGNPLNLEIFWTLEQCIEGINDACCSLEIPVISGNVSLFNQSSHGAISPTPIIAGVGVIENSYKKFLDPITQWFKQEGDMILLLGETLNEFGASEFSRIILNKEICGCPRLDLNKEKKLYRAVLESYSEHLIQSMHDCSEGGVGVALAESCVSGSLKFGAQLDFNCHQDPNVFLFSESQSRILMSCKREDFERNVSIFSKHQVPFFVLGIVQADRLCVNNWIDCEISELDQAFSFHFFE